MYSFFWQYVGHAAAKPKLHSAEENLLSRLTSFMLLGGGEIYPLSLFFYISLFPNFVKDVQPFRECLTDMDMNYRLQIVKRLQSIHLSQFRVSPCRKLVCPSYIHSKHA
jgi:hypothetical protein